MTLALIVPPDNVTNWINRLNGRISAVTLDMESERIATNYVT